MVATSAANPPHDLRIRTTAHPLSIGEARESNGRTADNYVALRLRPFLVKQPANVPSLLPRITVRNLEYKARSGARERDQEGTASS